MIKQIVLVSALAGAAIMVPATAQAAPVAPSPGINLPIVGQFPPSGGLQQLMNPIELVNATDTLIDVPGLPLDPTIVG
ncbi:hypothetical protein ABZY19_07095 [Streptomyces sp. NPDC006475]|uniref:Uncharacterized protein n=1 Tax=Streptomyces achmelvichensis TaxID=3134111 RepID=A0ACC6PYN4_9ACTN|nr:hypothetical protein OG317_21275 [Streptomyces sp. NBC_01167]